MGGNAAPREDRDRAPGAGRSRLARRIAETHRETRVPHDLPALPAGVRRLGRPAGGLLAGPAGPPRLGRPLVSPRGRLLDRPAGQPGLTAVGGAARPLALPGHPPGPRLPGHALPRPSVSEPPDPSPM